MYEPIEVDNYCNILLETFSIDPKGVPSSSSEVEVGCTIWWFGKLPLFGQKLDQNQQDVFFPHPNKKHFTKR